MTQQKVTLPPSLMATVHLIGESDMEPVEALTAVLLLTHGYGLWCAKDSIDPSAMAIPKEQWGEIAEVLMNLRGTDVARVNLSLDWMNKGPSGYEVSDGE